MNVFITKNLKAFIYLCKWRKKCHYQITLVKSDKSNFTRKCMRNNFTQHISAMKAHQSNPGKQNVKLTIFAWSSGLLIIFFGRCGLVGGAGRRFACDGATSGGSFTCWGCLCRAPSLGLERWELRKQCGNERDAIVQVKAIISFLFKKKKK